MESTLLEARVDVSSVDGEAGPLPMAAEGGYEEILQMPVSPSADVKIQGAGALEVAEREGGDGVVRVLLEPVRLPTHCRPRLPMVLSDMSRSIAS